MKVFLKAKDGPKPEPKPDEDDVEARFSRFSAGAAPDREDRGNGEVHPDFFYINIQLAEKIYKDISVIGRRLEEKRKA